MKPNSYSIVGLKRWSCKSKEIPGVPQIKFLHVYDFDNTLFCSPLPNPQLWDGQTIGRLQTENTFASGGWWHDPSILAATGDGVDAEEQRAWEGWWNEVIVKLVELSTQQKDALTVMLTGRAETGFAALVNRILNAKKLDFDLVVLKPEAGPANQRFSSTMEFKQEFLRDLVFTYKAAEEIRVYEDRPKHVKGFRDYFERLNKSLLSHPVNEPPPIRKPIIADVVHVCEMNSALDMNAETLAIQNLINGHNAVITSNDRNSNPKNAPPRLWTIKENFIYCGYLISGHDSARLLSLTNIPASSIDSSEVRLMASNILISPFFPSQQILNRVGGRGKKVTWQVTGYASHENRIWAARVNCVNDGEKVYTHDPIPLVVLACRKGTRPIDAHRIQRWSEVPPEKAFIFETVVGDKIVLRVEEDYSAENQNQNQNQPNGNGNVRSGYGSNSRYANNTQTTATQPPQKRKFRDRGSRSPEHKGKDNYPAGPPGAKRIESLSSMNANANGERDDGSWIPPPRAYANPGVNANIGGSTGGGGGGGGDKHAQSRYFNQVKHQQGTAPGQQQPQQQQGQGQGQGGRKNNPAGGGGGGGGGRQNQNQNQNQGSQPRSRAQQQQQQGQGRHHHQRNRGGNAGGGGGFQGYKSLDDFPPHGGAGGGGGFDGSADMMNGGGSGGAGSGSGAAGGGAGDIMMMNY